jgi:hypothetical protein
MQLELDLIGKQARAFDGVAYQTVAEGEIIAYSIKPMVCIKTVTGEKVWWAAGLTELVEVED